MKSMENKETNPWKKAIIATRDKWKAGRLSESGRWGDKNKVKCLDEFLKAGSERETQGEKINWKPIHDYYCLSDNWVYMETGVETLEEKNEKKKLRELSDNKIIDFKKVIKEFNDKKHVVDLMESAIRIELNKLKNYE